MMRNKHGFTLVELIVALFVGSLVLVAIYSTVNIAQRSSSGLVNFLSRNGQAF